LFAVVWLAGLTPAAANAQTPPAASPVERTTAVSGYMDFHFNKPEFADGRLDFHRFVLLITHSFSDRIRFVSELELEHALKDSRRRVIWSSNRPTSIFCSRAASTCAPGCC
jgi:hypothetical protein